MEIQFKAEGNGTRVTLIHRGWEGRASLLGEAAQAERKGYEGGWNLVLGRYVQQADPASRIIFQGGWEFFGGNRAVDQDAGCLDPRILVYRMSLHNPHKLDYN